MGRTQAWFCFVPKRVLVTALHYVFTFTYLLGLTYRDMKMLMFDGVLCLLQKEGQVSINAQ